MEIDILSLFYVVPITAQLNGHNAFFSPEIPQSGNKTVLWPLDGTNNIGTTFLFRLCGCLSHQHNECFIRKAHSVLFGCYSYGTNLLISFHMGVTVCQSFMEQCVRCHPLTFNPILSTKNRHMGDPFPILLADRIR